MPEPPPESRIDVRLLGDKELPRADFPGGKGEAFRVYFAPAVHEALWKHASEDTSVEICGVLVGTWERDAVGPFVRVSESIRGEAADNKFAEVTFTHETWARINARMDSDFSHLAIVGWYHTHPDFGIFLSDRDRFIHEHFFAGAGQVAHVIDPVRKSEGVFVWREGTPSLTDHYWVGDRLVHAAAATGERDGAAQPAVASPSPPPVTPAGRSLPTQLLAYVALVLLGYMLSGLRSAWEDQMLREGAVYHFGIWKGLRPGLREELDRVDRDLAVISRAIQARDDGSSGKKGSEVTTAQVLAGLTTVGKRLDAIRTLYAYNDTEQEAVRRFVQGADALVRGRAEPRDETPDRAKPEPSPAAAKDSPSEKPNVSQ